MSWMNPFRHTRLFTRGTAATIDEIGRDLYMFDIEIIAPYDHDALIAFLKADKLSDLSSEEIRIFLLLRDNMDPHGYTDSYIAEHLAMTLPTVRSCLGSLRWKGYAEQSNVVPILGEAGAALAWVVDRANEWTDPDLLFSEFARL